LDFEKSRPLATREHLKKCRAIRRHGWNQQVSIKKQISHFAARLGNEQAAMACCAVRRAIAAPVVWLMIGAYRIVRADGRALESAPQDASKSRRRTNKTAQSTLCTRSRRIK
jgi:hypothetical protein